MRGLQPGLVRCPPDCGWEGLQCPPDCSGFKQECPTRFCPKKSKCAEPIEHFVNRTLSVVWRHLPYRVPTSAWQPTGTKLILVTITFPHKLQLYKLEHCARILSHVENVLWIVAEDAKSTSADVALLLANSGVAYRHLAEGPTRKGGNAQRNAALSLIRRERMRGIVYQMDDDNAYHPTLWPELRRLRPMRVGVLAVRRGVYPPPACDGVFEPLAKTGFKRRDHMIERPTYSNRSGAFTGFESGWCDPGAWTWVNVGPRTFCVDMAGFAFDAALLQRVPAERAIWNYTGHGGESELIASLLGAEAVAEDLQPLANCGQDVLVFHNEYRTVPQPVRRPPMHCGTDGWGYLDDAERRKLPRRPWPSTYALKPGKKLPSWRMGKKWQAARGGKGKGGGGGRGGGKGGGGRGAKGQGARAMARVQRTAQNPKP